LLYKFELTQKDDAYSWFTCACLAYSSDTGEEFIAVATSNGIVFRVEVSSGVT